MYTPTMLLAPLLERNEDLNPVVIEHCKLHRTDHWSHPSSHYPPSPDTNKREFKAQKILGNNTSRALQLYKATSIWGKTNYQFAVDTRLFKNITKTKKKHMKIENCSNLLPVAKIQDSRSRMFSHYQHWEWERNEKSFNYHVPGTMHVSMAHMYLISNLAWFK